MNFTFLCLVISQYLLCGAYAVYTKDVTCIKDYKSQSYVCKASRSARRSANSINNNIPTHDPYIPRSNAVIYQCSSLECKSVALESMTQVTSPKIILKSCFLQTSEKYACETIRYNYFKNIDKLLFLSSNVRNKTFYLVDCLVYSDGGRICHKKDDVDSYTKLVDTGTLVRPNETNVLSQEEFICEQGSDRTINCDLNAYVPFNDGLKRKNTDKIDGDILLKTGTYLATLSKNCIDSWCGYSGRILSTRRSSARYETPGGKVYRCYYAKKQQICKELYNKQKLLYNARGWLSAR